MSDNEARSTPRRAWSNWSGIETCEPARIVNCKDVGDVQRAVLGARHDGLTVRAVGFGHSFTGAAVAPDVQLRLTRLSEVVHIDATTGVVKVGAGIQLARVNEVLAAHGLAMENLGDIDKQTLFGVISTGTHGTGAKLKGLAAQVIGLELVLADGSVVECSAGERPELFAAAQISLGVLGIITAVTLQTVPAFVLRAVEAPAGLDDVLDGLEESFRSHDHFEFYWFPHTSRTLTKANDRVDERPKPLPRWRFVLDDEILSNGLFAATNRLASWVPRTVPAINAVASRALTARDYTDSSYRVFVSPRRVRFVESEYAVPRASIGLAIRELKRWVETHDASVPFPVEVRAAAADNLWLSTAYGRETGYIAIHQFHKMEYAQYFDAFESIVRDVGGRPHWGKLHKLDAENLRGLYPRFDDFLRLRDELDPERRFANPYTQRVFGR